MKIGEIRIVCPKQHEREHFINIMTPDISLPVTEIPRRIPVPALEKQIIAHIRSHPRKPPENLAIVKQQPGRRSPTVVGYAWKKKENNTSTIWYYRAPDP